VPVGNGCVAAAAFAPDQSQLKCTVDYVLSSMAKGCSRQARLPLVAVTPWCTIREWCLRVVYTWFGISVMNVDYLSYGIQLV